MASSSRRVRGGRFLLRAGLISVSALALAACAGHHGARYASRPTAKSHSAKPPVGGYKVGPPYQAGGLWYVPAEQPDYDEVGMASWYGDEFDGRPTANGERFDMRAVSAAHTTLPIPSIVEVTNLENGRSIEVRLNDRGPFKPGRIIDLSHAGALALGFAAKGTAKVRVRYLRPAPVDGFAPQTVAVREAPRRAAPVVTASAAPPTAFPPIWPSTPPAAATPSAAAVTSSSLPPIWPSTPPPAAPPAPAQYAALPAETGFAIQAGAFADRLNAERLALRLQPAGRADIRPIERNGALLYRVMMGPWPDEAQAWAILQRLAELGFDQARVVRF